MLEMSSSHQRTDKMADVIPTTSANAFSNFLILRHLCWRGGGGADSRFAPRQWETELICNSVSHWLGAIREPAAIYTSPCLGDLVMMWGCRVEKILTNIHWCICTSRGHNELIILYLCSTDKHFLKVVSISHKTSYQTILLSLEDARSVINNSFEIWQVSR